MGALLLVVQPARAQAAQYGFSGDRYAFMGFEQPSRKPKKAKRKKHRKPVAPNYIVRPQVPMPKPRPVLAAEEDPEATIWSHPLASVLPAHTASSVRGNLLRGFARELARTLPSRSLTGVVAPLAAKATQIMAACPGARVISARIGRERSVVRGSGRPSLHRTGRAVDMAGNPRCMYAQLRGWRGGVSTDYAAVAHVHFSYAPGGREWGARFAHWRPGKRKTRVAMR